MPNDRDSQRVAEILVVTGAVTFRTDPFYRFTSGTESPIYVDNRRLLGYVDLRSEVVSSLARVVEELSNGAPCAIAGTATAGIPWAAWLAEYCRLPMLYVRASRKDWGHQRTVEGYAPEGYTVVVVEDLTFTAGSLVTAAANLRTEGFAVNDSVSIVTYETSDAGARLAGLNLNHRALCTVDDALAVASALGYLSTDQVAIVAHWLNGLRDEQPCAK